MPCLLSSRGTPFGFCLLLCMFGLPYSSWVVFLTPMVHRAQYNDTLALPCPWSSSTILSFGPSLIVRPSLLSVHHAQTPSLTCSIANRPLRCTQHITTQCTQYDMTRHWNDTSSSPLAYTSTYEMWTQPKKSQTTQVLCPSFITHA